MRVIKAKNFAKKTMFVLIVVFSINIQAQEKPTDFLKDYFLVGAFGQYTNNLKGNVVKEDPTVNFEVASYITPQFGVVVNVYQTQHFNFKTGLIIKPKVDKFNYNFTKEQTGADHDVSYWASSSGDDNMWSVPLIAEYIVPISKRVKWMIAPSFTMSFYQFFGGYGIEGFGPPPTAKITETDDDRSEQWFHTSAEISTGFYFLFKHFMLQPEFRYSKSFNTLKSGSYVTENYRTEPSSSTGTFTQSGDYWGVSLTVYIKKKRKK
ncbi:MAG: hypothetical protein PSN34_13995 [Urechidicola sp.]|nr:hypothetical protein [Urechidicola sp.]